MVRLTPREREVTAAICAGLSNKQIAKQLGISHQTVKNHVRLVMSKLMVSCRTQVVLRFATVGAEGGNATVEPSDSEHSAAAINSTSTEVL